jgi:hypothetical protein
VQLGWLTEHEPARLGWASRVQAHRRRAAQEPLDGDVSLQARQVHPDAHVRAVREREVPVRVIAPRVKAIGIRAHRRVAVGTGDRDAHELAAADPRAGEPHLGSRMLGLVTRLMLRVHLSA